MKQTSRWMGSAVLLVGLAAMGLAAVNKKAAVPPLSPATESKADLLAVGAYTAKLKAFACGGCAEWVKEQLSSVSGLNNVRVDQATARVEFTLEKPVSRKLIQKTLDGAAHEMGMGADYTLGDLKPKTK